MILMSTFQIDLLLLLSVAKLFSDIDASLMQPSDIET